jgi:sulfoquinovosyltransferase
VCNIVLLPCWSNQWDDESEVSCSLTCWCRACLHRSVKFLVDDAGCGFHNFVMFNYLIWDDILQNSNFDNYSSPHISNWNYSFFSFPCPLYQNVPLSLALSPRIFSEVTKFKPDIIHATSPGVMVIFVNQLYLLSFRYVAIWFLLLFSVIIQIFGALAIAKMTSVPILMSYHTHLPAWVPLVEMIFVIGTWVYLRVTICKFSII